MTVRRFAYRVLLGLLAFGVMLVPGLGQGTATAAGPAAQDIPEPPPLVAVYFESPLTEPDVFAPGVCPSGGAGGENVDEGFKLTVRGRCQNQASGAAVSLRANTIAVGDGEVAIDFKVVAGVERAGLNLYVRIQGNTYVSTYLSFATGQAELFKRDENGSTLVAAREGFGEVDPANWNRLALRFVGEEVWLLVNDEPILYGAGMVDQNGGLGVQVVREGNPDDGDEVAIVFKDLVLSGFALPQEEEPAPPSEGEEEPAPNPVLRP